MFQNKNYTRICKKLPRQKAYIHGILYCRTCSAEAWMLLCVQTKGTNSVRACVWNPRFCLARRFSAVDIALRSLQSLTPSKQLWNGIGFKKATGKEKKNKKPVTWVEGWRGSRLGPARWESQGLWERREERHLSARQWHEGQRSGCTTQTRQHRGHEASSTVRVYEAAGDGNGGDGVWSMAKGLKTCSFFKTGSKK